MQGLKPTQTEMLAFVAASGAAWVTSRGSPNHDLLRGWEEKGYFEAADDAPFPLVGYRITEAGRRALTEEG